MEERARENGLVYSHLHQMLACSELSRNKIDVVILGTMVNIYSRFTNNIVAIVSRRA